MSVVFSGSFSGTFVSTGASQFIDLPSGADWMWIKNETVSYAGGAGSGAEFYWRVGMPQGRGTLYTKEATIGALVPTQVAANAGFFLQDTSIIVPGASRAITSITNANPPVVATGNTGGLIANDTIVRIYSTTGAQQLRGIDFTVGTVVNNTSFTLAYMSPIVAGTNGTYRVIPFNPYFYPSSRYITKVATGPSLGLAAGVSVVTLSVTHSYTVGQKVRLIVPQVTAAAFGMTELNGLQVTIVNIGQADADGITNTITIDVDSTAFTAFAFPLTADPAFTPAQVVPMGEDTAQALINPYYPALNGQNVIGDATINQARVGMLLMAGAASPAGVAGNVINWVAGKSFNQ